MTVTLPAMLVTQAAALGVVGSLLLGVSMGLTACTVTCLPFMGTWVLGRGRGRAGALRDTGAFLAGRLFAYGVLGTLAGAAGAALLGALAGGIGNLAIGAASCVAGLWLLRPVLAGTASRIAAARPGEMPLRPAGSGPESRGGGCATRRRGAHLPPALLGASLSLTPCAPLGWLLAACAQAGSAAGGLAHGLAFGLGAAVTPLLLLVPLFGAFGERLTAGRGWLGPWLAGGAGLVLIALGARRILL